MNLQQEEDHVPTKRIAIALAATIGLTIACLIWVWAVMKPFEASAVGKPRTPRSQAQPAARSSDVDRTLYSWGGGFAAELLSRKRAELESWGWVDKSAGVVRIPIERAMQLIVDEDRR
jgi:hypothetical protein